MFLHHQPSVSSVRVLFGPSLALRSFDSSCFAFVVWASCFLLSIGPVMFRRLFALHLFRCSLCNQFYSLSRGHISLIGTPLQLQNVIKLASVEALQPCRFHEMRAPKPLVCFNIKEGISLSFESVPSL